MTLLPDEANVREQLARIFASEAFRVRSTNRVLLQHLVEQTLKGNADRLTEYNLALDVFNKDETYASNQEGSVRSAVGRVRKKLIEYYSARTAETDPVHIEIPKG